MELLLQVLLEFVVQPILSAISLTLQFVFWMCCWVVVGFVRGVRAVGGWVSRGRIKHATERHRIDDTK